MIDLFTKMVNSRRNERPPFRNNMAFLRFIRGQNPQQTTTRAANTSRRGSRSRGHRSERRRNGRQRIVTNSRSQSNPPFSQNFYSQLCTRHTTCDQSSQILRDDEVEDFKQFLPGFMKYYGHTRPTIDDFMQKIEGVIDYCGRLGIPQDPTSWSEANMCESGSLEFSLSLVLTDEQFMGSWQNFATELNNYPEEVLKVWAVACHKLIYDAAKNASTSQTPPIIKRVIASFHTRDRSISLKQVRAETVGKYISSRGRCIGQGSVVPIVLLLTFECCQCETVVIIPQTDGVFRPPTNCTNCNVKSNFKILTDDKQNVLVDSRKLKLQDISGDTDGSIPRTLNCIIYGDMVDMCKVGDLIEFTGIVKVMKIKSIAIFISRHNNLQTLDNEI